MAVTGLTACKKNPNQAAAQIEEPPLTGNAAVLQQYLDLNASLENTAYKILQANTDRCPEVSFETGMYVHTVRDYPETLKELVAEKLSLGEKPSIRHIVSGSPADRAGLKLGDKILSVNELEIVSGENARPFFETVMRRELLSGSMTLKVLRAGKTIERLVTAEKVCGYPVKLFFGDYVNAYTDGEEIWVTTELVETIGSEEGLAMIIAHEMAHATEGHIFKEPTRQFELDADRLGMIYLVKAGYDGRLALTQWTANPLNHKSQIGESHPNFEERWRVLDAALAETRQ